MGVDQTVGRLKQNQRAIFPVDGTEGDVTAALGVSGTGDNLAVVEEDKGFGIDVDVTVEGGVVAASGGGNQTVPQLDIAGANVDIAPASGRGDGVE